MTDAVLTGTEAEGQRRPRIALLDILQLGLGIAVLIGASFGGALVQVGGIFRVFGAGLLGLGAAGVILLMFLAEPWRRDE